MTSCRSEAESNKASSGASTRERHGLEQELATAKACEAALSRQVLYQMPTDLYDVA